MDNIRCPVITKLYKNEEVICRALLLWMIKNPNLHGFTAAGWAKTKIMKNNKRTT